ncbi:DUF6887 family protein [Iningainema tapete]|uniref:Uncharacterized protein n=1 Tax=Iningainema tapete BLCC-T55 TaxID=2748662 RepID=A0A8J7CDF8_9CYAN|nr:hypothetical protein [Iningainema tapete]MBD2772785.1 hypothetical protein [Iningainema tapete BLCC-T55]
MSEQDFKAMSRAQLRAYVLQNPEDKEAFYELSDRIRATAKPINVEDLPDLIRRKSQQ